MLWIFALLMKIQHHQLIGRYPQHPDACVVCQSFHPRRLYVEALIQPIKKWLDAHFPSPIHIQIILIQTCVSSSLWCGSVLNFYRHYQTSLQQVFLISLDFISQPRVIVMCIAQHFLYFIGQQASQLASYFSFRERVFSEIAPYRDDRQTGRGSDCDVRTVALHPSSIIRLRPRAVAINSSEARRDFIELSVCLVPKRSLSLDHLLINSDYLSRSQGALDQLTRPSSNLALDGGLQLLEALAQGRFIGHLVKTASSEEVWVSQKVAIQCSKLFDTFEHHQHKDSKHHQFRVVIWTTWFSFSRWRIDFAHFFQYFNEVVVGGLSPCQDKPYHLNHLAPVFVPGPHLTQCGSHGVSQRGIRRLLRGRCRSKNCTH